MSMVLLRYRLKSDLAGKTPALTEPPPKIALLRSKTCNMTGAEWKILYDTKWPTCFVTFFQTLSKSIVLQSRPTFKLFRHSARHFFQKVKEKRRMKFHYSLFSAAKTRVFRLEFTVFSSWKYIIWKRFTLLFTLRIIVKISLLCRLIYYR